MKVEQRSDNRRIHERVWVESEDGLVPDRDILLIYKESLS